MKSSSDRILSALRLRMSSPSIVTDAMFDYGFAQRGITVSRGHLLPRAFLRPLLTPLE